MSKTYIGIDNGPSGAIGILYPDGDVIWGAMPVRLELNYTKAKKNISRLEVDRLEHKFRIGTSKNSIAIIERPMVNSARFQATISAVRFLEATLIVLERLKIPYQYIDSKEWQKAQLPSGLRKEELKRASLDMGRRLWPHIKFPPKADADALLIARHAKLKNL